MKVAWSPDGKRLASVGADFLVIAWDADTGRKLSTMRGHNDFVEAVVWSPDGTRLASAGIDNSVRIWDPQTGEEAFVLRGDSGMFHDVSWSPDGAQLAAASNDGQIWIWDATRGFERDTTPRALPYIDRRVASGTARGDDLLWCADSYIRAGKPGTALAVVKDNPYQLRELTPRLFAAYRTLGDRRSLEMLEHYPAATAAIADLYATQKDWQRAITEYSKLISAEPGDRESLEKRARAYVALGRCDLARSSWLRAIERQPALLQHAFDSFMQLERWSEAAEFGMKLVEDNPKNSLLWLRIAPLLVLAGDEAAYSAFCTRMAMQFAAIATPAEAEQTIMSCLLRANAIDLAKLPRDTLANYLDGGAQPGYLRSYAWATRALFAYRGGDAESAAKYATNSQQLNPVGYIQAVNLAVLAMAQHRLRHPDQARRAFKEASQVTGRLAAEANNRGQHDALVAQILLHEAEALIK
jgi:tetratricopeptide (TPR) repeat protein